MNEDDKATKPTIETVLERINVLAQQLQTFQENTNTQLTEMREIIVRLEEKQDKLQAEIETVKEDLRTGLKRVERKIAILNDNMLVVQADQRDHENRIEKLESKPL